MGIISYKISSALLALCINNGMINEGFSSRVYKDVTGYSIGYGYSLTSNPLNLSKSTLNQYRKHGITKWSARNLLSKSCVSQHSQLVTAYDWYPKVKIVPQYVLLDMSYNLGTTGLAGFKKSLSLIKRGKNSQASKEILDSKWRRQVKSRATRLSEALRTGKLS